VESSAFAGLDQILLIAGNDPAVATAVKSAVETQWTPRSLARALKRRAGMNAVLLENLRAAGPSSLKPLIHNTAVLPEKMDAQQWNAFIDENASLLLRHLRTIIAVADKPLPQSYPVILADEVKVNSDTNPHHALLQMMDEKYNYLADQRATEFSRAAVTRAAAAVLAWQGRHRGYPSNLGQAIKPVPADPFNGAPLGYKQERQGFVIYSVGRTGKYTGGRIDREPVNTESSFRYPLPSILNGPIKDE